MCSLPAYAAHTKGFLNDLDIGATLRIAPTEWTVPERLLTVEVQFAVIPGRAWPRTRLPPNVEGSPDSKRRQWSCDRDNCRPGGAALAVSPRTTDLSFVKRGSSGHTTSLVGGGERESSRYAVVIARMQEMSYCRAKKLFNSQMRPTQNEELYR